MQKIGYIIRIDVERNGGTYYVGTFADRSSAVLYCEQYHGDLDRTEIIEMYNGFISNNEGE